MEGNPDHNPYSVSQQETGCRGQAFDGQFQLQAFILQTYDKSQMPAIKVGLHEPWELSQGSLLSSHAWV